MMKVEEFLKKLRKTPRKWYINGSGLIRLGPREAGMARLCPIEAAGNGDPYTADKVGKSMGLPSSLVVRIMEAADNETKGLWRRRLLKACGLA